MPGGPNVKSAGDDSRHSSPVAHGGTCQSGAVPPPDSLAADALLAMLFPFWQLVIGCAVLVALVLSIHKFAARGGSRMVRALLLTGGAIVGIAAVGILLATW